MQHVRRALTVVSTTALLTLAGAVLAAPAQAAAAGAEISAGGGVGIDLSLALGAVIALVL